MTLLKDNDLNYDSKVKDSPCKCMNCNYTDLSVKFNPMNNYKVGCPKCFSSAVEVLSYPSLSVGCDAKPAVDKDLLKKLKGGKKKK